MAVGRGESMNSRGRPGRIRAGLALAVVALLAAGCDPSSPPVAAPPPPSPSDTIAPSQRTGPAEQTCPDTAAGGPTIRDGTGHGVQLTVMLFPTQPELTASKELKIVFRLTGDMDVTVRAVGPGDRVITPAWGPEWHGGSNFNAPGNEFGAGWQFTAPGCWDIQVTNRAGTADLVLRVAP
jgi:hypothetical protein